MKKILSIILSTVIILQCSAFFAYAVEGKEPVLSYSFENSENAPELFGNASLVFDEDKNGKVLSLDGSSGTYAEIPQGFFDNRDVMTIQFDILPKDRGNDWNYFSFCFGKNTDAYSFFRIRDNEIRNSITRYSYSNEQETITTKANYNTWMHIALVYNNTSLKLYVNGEMVSENANTGIRVSDLGNNLLSYFGNSLYNGDAFFNGCFDNFEVYDSVLSDSEIEAAYESNIPEMPVLRYTFEDGSKLPALNGNAATVWNDEKDGKVLSLNATNNTFAELPQGFFDGRDVMTIQFDVLPHQIWGNYFTFCFGKNNTYYSYFRIRDDEIRNCVSLSSWQNEHDVRTTGFDEYDKWMHIALVYNNTNLKLYVNGEMVSENTDTGIRVSDMGSDLLSYIGKSLYDGDGWYNGLFDNFEVYDRVLSDDEIEETYVKNIYSLPDLRYTFEDGTTKPTFFGNAAAVYDEEKKSKVLSLDGSANTYAAIPQGYFDGKDKMTVLFDVKSINNGGNYFTFAIGQDSQRYDFFRVRGSEIRNAITVNSYTSEHEVKTTGDFTDSWMHIAIVFDDETCKLYVNGSLAATNNNSLKISELGSNLLAYFGKSFYDGDGYFKGKFDNFEVHNRVLGNDEIKEKAMKNLPLLISVNVGEVVSNLDDVSGTDSHTMVSTSINRSNGEITSIIQRRQDPKAVPVNFISLNSDCRVLVDSEEYPSSCTLDLTYDRNVKIICNDTTEQYTLKAAQIANNPVLPGMYADPDLDVFDGKFWIYPTTDGVPGWGGTQFHAFSSEDMETWTDEGVILDNKDKNPGVNAKGVQIASSKWSNGNAWAPSIEEKDGKYYFYYCGAILDEYKAQYGDGMAIGVAYADSPAGPYTASDEPILYPSMMSEAIPDFWGQVIDPAIYTEGDKSYILFGNGRAFIAELNSDMTTVDQSTIREVYNLEGFRESVAVFKRNGIYYWHWSCDDTGSENYHIRYGTSTSLDGEVTYRGVLLEKDPDNGILATGHQSIIYLPETDKCFIAYHRFYTPLSIGGNVGHHRETCIDEITFNRNVGSVDLLNKVTPTMESVGKVDINGVPKENHNSTSLQNKKLEWDLATAPPFTQNGGAGSVNATYGDAVMNLVYYNTNSYSYDGSNGLRTSDGYVYIENLASKLDDGKDIDINISLITNGRYNSDQAGSFAIGSAKALGDNSAFNDLLRLKNDGTIDYRGAGSNEDIRAGAKSAVTQGEHTFRIYFRNSTKTVSVYQDGKLIGFKQDSNLSKSKFNFLAIGVWRDSYYGNITLEKVTISQPVIKDSGYVNKDTVVSGIAKQSVSQNINYNQLAAVIDEINSAAFQSSYNEIKNNEELYTISSIDDFYAALNRVKTFDALAPYDYSNTVSVNGAADEVLSIVSDYNAYKVPDLRADLTKLQKAYDKANNLLLSLNGKAAQYDKESIEALISAVSEENVSTYLSADAKARANYGQAVQADADALAYAINNAFDNLKLSVDDEAIDTSAYEAAAAIINNLDPDAYNQTTSITSARNVANALVSESEETYKTATISVFNAETTAQNVNDATISILSALSTSVKTYTVTTQGVSETTFRNGTADGDETPYTATYGTTVICKSDNDETAWYMEISSGTSHRTEQFQGYGKGLKIKVIGNMTIKAVKPSATTHQVKIIRNYDNDDRAPVQLVDYVAAGSNFTIPEPPAFAYYTFGGYEIGTTSYAAGDVVTVDADTEIIAKYNVNSDASCAINATDIDNNAQNMAVAYNNKVELNGGSGAYAWVEETDANKFRPFYIGNDISFFASESTNLKAVSQEAFDAYNFTLPCINLRKSGVITSDTKKIFNAQLFDAGKEVKEYGILIGVPSTYNEVEGYMPSDLQLVVENSGQQDGYRVIRAKSTRLVGANQFSIAVNNLPDDFAYRGYVIYENSDNEFVTAYTNLLFN